MKKLRIPRILGVYLLAVMLLLSACAVALPMEPPDEASGAPQQFFGGEGEDIRDDGMTPDGAGALPDASQTYDANADSSVGFEDRGTGAPIDSKNHAADISVDSNGHGADVSVDSNGHGADTQARPNGSDTRLPVYGGYYYDLTNVVLYLEIYGELPPNYITKKDARALGWEGGSVEQYKEGAAIGGDYFGNYEGLLPYGDGQRYTECDIDSNGYSSRGSRRLVFSDDGRYFYTSDHYESFSEYRVTTEYEVIPCE